MKKGYIIFFVILGIVLILVIALGIYGYITYLEIQELTSLSKDTSIQDDFNALMKGDCTRISNIESKTTEIETKITKDCKNPIIRYIIEKNSPKGSSLCLMASGNNSPMAQMRQGLSAIKEVCKNNSIPMK